MSEQSKVSASPAAALAAAPSTTRAPHEAGADVEVAEEKKTSMKRGRESALGGPTTPRSEEDLKVLTPAAKKGRTEDEAATNDKEPSNDEGQEHIRQKVQDLKYEDQQAVKQPDPDPTVDKTAPSGFAGFAQTASPFATAKANATETDRSDDEPDQVAPSSPVSAKVSASEAKDTAASPASAKADATSVKPASSTPVTTAAPQTPAPKSSAFSSLASTSRPSTLSTASPFAAFASKSGFAATGGGSKAPATGSAFGSYSSTATASPFASVKTAPSTKDAPSKGGDGDDAPSSSGAGASLTTATTTTDDASTEAEDKKKKYTEQELVTGEEAEDMVHSVRCKLYAMVSGSWVERGTGPMRVNVARTKEAGEPSAAEGEDENPWAERDAPESSTPNQTLKPSVRLVMRAEATHRLLLNAPLFKSFAIEVSNEKYVRFAVIDDKGEPTSYMLRMANTTAAETFVAIVKEQIKVL